MTPGRAWVGGLLLLAVGCRTRLEEAPANQDLTASAVDMSTLVDLMPVPDMGSCIGVDPAGAPTVVGTSVAENAPVPVGGTVAPGKYFFASWLSYTGPGGAHGGAGAPAIEAIEFGDGTWNASVPIPNTVDWMSSSGTFSTVNTTMTMTTICPKQSVAHFQYTATPTQLVWMAPFTNNQSQLVETIVYTFTRQ